MNILDLQETAFIYNVGGDVRSMLITSPCNVLLTNRASHARYFGMRIIPGQFLCRSWKWFQNISRTELYDTVVVSFKSKAKIPVKKRMREASMCVIQFIKAYIQTIRAYISAGTIQP